MPGGQPTKYNKGILAKANDYLENHIKYDDVIPSAIGLGLHLDVDRKTIYNWKAAHPEFFHILGRINDKQHQLLISNGLNSTFNSNIVKLVLGKHGYHDKQDVNANMNHSISDMTEAELDRKMIELEAKNEQSTRD